MAHAQITLLQSQGGVELLNVMNMFVPANTAEVHQALCDQVRAAYADSGLAAWLSNDWSFVGIRARALDGGTPFSVEYTPAAGFLAGTAIANQLPRQVALLVSTAFNGPKPNRGRVYISGFTEAAWNGDVWSPTAMEVSAEFVGILASGVNVGTGNARYLIGTFSPSTNTLLGANFVNTIVSRSYAAVQRRRRN